MTDDPRMPKQRHRHWTDRWPGWLLVIASAVTFAGLLFGLWWLVESVRL